MTAPTAATDRLGAVVATPPAVDPGRWRLLCAQVVMLPNGCHLWTGAPRRADGYGQFWAAATDLRSAADLASGALFPVEFTAAVDARPRVWRAHRFAWSALTGDHLTRDDHLMHLCDQPLCVPITAEALDAHLALTDNTTNAHDRDHKGRTVTPGHIGRTAWSRGPASGPVRRSMAIHAAISKALTSGTTRAKLAAAVATADRFPVDVHQPTLF